RCARSWPHHHDFPGFGEAHAQAGARDLVDAVALGPGGLLQLQLPELDIELVAGLLQLGQLDEQLAVLVAREHDRDRGEHVADDQQREQDAQHHACTPLAASAAATGSRSATRNTALRARGLRASSSPPALRAPPMARSVGVNGAGGRRRSLGGALLRAAMNCLAIRSSSEWKLITARRPPPASRCIAAAGPDSRSASSRLMKMRMPWKLRVAGWIRLRSLPDLPRGTAAAISSASCAVRVIGCRARSATMARAIRRDWRSSP